MAREGKGMNGLPLRDRKRLLSTQSTPTTKHRRIVVADLYHK